MNAHYDDRNLYHHGIKGQRWGVRRYQNKDGSLTPEGRRKYRNIAGNYDYPRIKYAQIKAGRQYTKSSLRVSELEKKGKSKIKIAAAYLKNKLDEFNSNKALDKEREVFDKVNKAFFDKYFGKKYVDMVVASYNYDNWLDKQPEEKKNASLYKKSEKLYNRPDEFLYKYNESINDVIREQFAKKTSFYKDASDFVGMRDSSLYSPNIDKWIGEGENGYYYNKLKDKKK